MKIHEAKENLQLAINLLDKLKTDPSEELQQKLDNLLESFTPDTVSDLKKKLAKVKKRRLRNAEKRKKLKAVKAEIADQRRRQAAEVDRLFLQHQETESRLKTEESVRRQADVVLQEVTRRKADARRILTLLPALAKLRAGRVQRAVAQGATPSAEATESFETAVGYLRGLWEKQLDEYNAEEAGLKIMLDEGSASKLGQAERDLDANLHEWHLAMFGQGSRPDLSWQELVSVRSQWDQYVVAPDTVLSSSIPEGWLLPQTLPDETWKNAVVFD